MPDKIRISCDDVNHPHVDDRINQQKVLQRAQQHYDQIEAQSTPSAASSMPGAQARRFISHAVLAMALFGCVGGFVGWALGEMWWKTPNALEEYLPIDRAEDEIATLERAGNLSSAESASLRERLHAEFSTNPYLRIEQDKSLSDSEKEHREQLLVAEDLRRLFLRTILWCSSIGIAIAAAISVAEPVTSRNFRRTMVNALAGTLLGAAGGFIVGLFLDRLYSSLGGGLADSLSIQQLFARSTGWGVLGLFLAIAPGLVLRSWRRSLIGLAGGFVGGMAGGLLFDPVAQITEMCIRDSLSAVR